MSVTTVKPLQKSRESMDKLLPNVALLVSDAVKLIRDNSVPVLQVQVEIIDFPDRDEDLCVLGLNDITYVVPEFTPSKY